MIHERCPCCESSPGVPHDPECTLKDDAPNIHSQLLWLAAHDASIREPLEQKIAEKDQRIATLESALRQAQECVAQVVSRDGHDFNSARWWARKAADTIRAALSGAGAGDDHDERVRADERKACANIAIAFGCGPTVVDAIRARGKE